MKKIIPEKTIEVCDCCEKEQDTHLYKCISCGCTFCYHCTGDFVESVVKPRICSTCSESTIVLKVIQENEGCIKTAIAARDAKLELLKPEGCS